MIINMEFNGMISGKAEERYWSSLTFSAIKIVGFAAISILPLFLALMYGMRSLIGIYSFGAMILILGGIAIATPMMAKNKNRDILLPRRIFFEDECIVAQTKQQTIYKKIEKVKKLLDYGEYYQIVFCFGHGANEFICQKNLLVNGTPEEFEAMFPNATIVEIIQDK